jgi:ubiquinone/menaquinone biosynthesis C-methylase UbiE
VNRFGVLGRGVGVVGGGLLALYLWERRHPRPLSYERRHYIAKPRWFLPVARLVEVLEPRPTDRILEVGPGTGAYTFEVAEALTPDGTLDILDIQQEMLDHVLREAGRRGLRNIRPTLSPAEQLPYQDDAFDSAYVINVLGEMDDRVQSLRELRRVLKPGGRLVLAENAYDPHWITLATLKRLTAEAGFEFTGHRGIPISYYASFRAA